MLAVPDKQKKCWRSFFMHVAYHTTVTTVNYYIKHCIDRICYSILNRQLAVLFSILEAWSLLHELLCIFVSSKHFIVLCVNEYTSSMAKVITKLYDFINKKPNPTLRLVHRSIHSNCYRQSSLQQTLISGINYLQRPECCV